VGDTERQAERVLQQHWEPGAAGRPGALINPAECGFYTISRFNVRPLAMV
jgi:hypothetical protein